jgi:ubiquinone/menaquinone biosynthesis C-methylase UbiE
MEIAEKKLGIPADYQYRALRFGPWIQRNWHKNKFSVFEETIPMSPRYNVLDLGTGSGNFELLFSHRYKSIAGVDYHDRALEFLGSQLRERSIGNVTLWLADIRKLPKGVIQKRYDLITIIDTLEHIKIDEAALVLKQLSNLLNKGGEILIITPNSQSPWKLIEWLLDKMTLVPKFAGQQHLAKFTPDSLRCLLESVGIRPTRHFTFNLVSYLWPWDGLNKAFLSLERDYLGDLGCLLCVVGKKV